MSTVKIKEAIVGKKTITVEKKRALYAQKCDCCGMVFKMNEYCNDTGLAIMKGTFDDMAEGMGNMFSATVCSFICADKIMKGGWKTIPDYKPYAKIKANLVRCELKITSYVIGEKELINQWNNLPIK